jgi:putative acetyltransferase
MQGIKIIVRLFKKEDTGQVVKIHFDSVHKIASKDYPEKVLDDWSPQVNEKRIKQFIENDKKVKNVALIAEIEGKIVGFGSLNPEKKEINAVYVSPNYLRKKVATKILNKLEKVARGKKTKNLSFPPL